MKNNRENIQAELAELGFEPGHKPSMPFRVPEGYFATSKQEVRDTILALDFVENLPKTMPQHVPAGYFEESKNEILASIGHTQPTPLQGQRRFNRKTWALAATMALLVSLGLFFINPNNISKPSVENQLSSLTTDEVKGYLESNAYEFEALDILENPQTTSKKMQELETEILNATKTMSDEELFVYVL